jgi:hypothetical protein
MNSTEMIYKVTEYESDRKLCYAGNNFILDIFNYVKPSISLYYLLLLTYYFVKTKVAT